jgi:hypothetical protein
MEQRCTSEKRGSKKMKQFWKYGLCPITGFVNVNSYTRVQGSGKVHMLERPMQKNNSFKNLKY